MKKATILIRRRHKQCEAKLEAFREGLEAHGWRTQTTTLYVESDLCVMWGVRDATSIARQKAHGGEVATLELGYIGDREKWTSVSFGGGLSRRGRFAEIRDASRFARHFGHLMQPWRTLLHGSVMIFGQVEGDRSIAHINPQSFYNEANDIYSGRGFSVKFRPHPLEKAGQPPIEQALVGVRFGVTYNSNSAVNAVLAGVPMVVCDEGSMAWEVAAHSLGSVPREVDRSDWAARLAWKQWTIDEMRSGQCWDRVSEKVRIAA